MEAQPIPDQLPVYHEGYRSDSAEPVSVDDLDPFGGYAVIEVTDETAEKYGYRIGEAPPLTVRRNMTRVGEAADMVGAKRVIMADIERYACLLADVRPQGNLYELMLRRLDG